MRPPRTQIVPNDGVSSPRGLAVATHTHVYSGFTLRRAHNASCESDSQDCGCEVIEKRNQHIADNTLLTLFHSLNYLSYSTL